MKITVKPKQTKEERKIPFDKIPVGYVYVANFYCGPILLKLNDNHAVLLSSHTGDSWFSLAFGYRGDPAYKILGKLTEIIVEEV